jgi:hypothetical protein
MTLRREPVRLHGRLGRSSGVLRPSCRLDRTGRLGFPAPWATTLCRPRLQSVADSVKCEPPSRCRRPPSDRIRAEPCLRRDVARSERGQCSVGPLQLSQRHIDRAIRDAMELRTESIRLSTIHQHLDRIQIVNHRSLQRVLAGEILHNAGRSMTHAVDERRRAASCDFFAKLPELAVEQQNVAKHQVG